MDRRGHGSMTPPGEKYAVGGLVACFEIVIDGELVNK